MAIASITLNSVVYSYASDQGGIITWRDTTGGIPTGFGTITMRMGLTPSKDGPYRVELGLRLPVVATDDSDCSCAGTLLRYENVRVSVELPQTGTAAERTDFAVRLKDLLANALVQAALSSLVRPG
jgi:hypothetical protein